MIEISETHDSMIENPTLAEKHDRLTAFLRAFELRTEVVAKDRGADANLFVACDPATGEACRIDLVMRGGKVPADADTVSARVIFGGDANPLLAALPDRLTFPLAHEPAWRAMADLFVAEARQRRCGGSTVRSRLGEVMVVLAVRRAIDHGGVGAGLLAGLAHPTLHRSLVAMHDDPKRPWKVAELSAIAAMSRGHFIVLFRAVVGRTPAAYLSLWRLTLGRQALLSGRGVKMAAHETGFGSAAAFSRAFSRHFGHAPGSLRPGEADALDVERYRIRWNRSRFKAGANSSEAKAP